MRVSARLDVSPAPRPGPAAGAAGRVIALAALVGCAPRPSTPAPSAAPARAPAAPAHAPAAAAPAAPAAAAAAAGPRGAAPVARVSSFTETLGDVTIRDPYRWLEAPSDEARAYRAAYDAYSRRVLDQIEGREALRREIAEDPDHQPRAFIGGASWHPERVFYTRQLGGEGDLSLLYREGWGGDEVVLLDVGERSVGGASWTVRSATPSFDGRYVVAELQRDGSEEPYLEIVDVDRRQILPDRPIGDPEVRIGWRPDARAFYYSTPGRDVHEHEIGGRADRVVFGPSLPELRLPREVYTGVDAAPGSRWLLAYANPGTSGSPEIFTAPLAHAGPGPRRWRRIATAADHVEVAALRGDRAYVLARGADARGRILAVELARGTVADAAEIVPPRDELISDLCAASDALYLRLSRGGTGLRRLDLDGKRAEDIALPMKGVVSYTRCEPSARGVLFGVFGKVHEAFRYAPGEPIARGGLYRPPAPSTVVTERVEARSADGTLVPLRIVSPPGLVKDGRAPALLSGYAAYGDPPLDIDGDDSAWSRRGGVTAWCGARGGGDRGEAWHRHGQKLEKENGVDDFIACATYLIDHGYTSPRRLTATGVSAGGVLVGGAITRRPELFTAAILYSAIVNLTRLHATPIGPANLVEFGDPAVPAELRAMLASDPLHRVRDGVRYPAVLLRAGENDSRVPPWQAAKLAARLAAATASGRPILLQAPRQQGHLTTPRPREIADRLDDYAFALWQSGILRGPGAP